METFNGETFSIGDLHKSIEKEWMLWRLVEEKGFSPKTLRYAWTRVDILKYNAILDMRVSSSYCEDGYRKHQDVVGGR